MDKIMEQQEFFQQLNFAGYNLCCDFRSIPIYMIYLTYLLKLNNKLFT